MPISLVAFVIGALQLNEEISTHGIAPVSAGWGAAVLRASIRACEDNAAGIIAEDVVQERDVPGLRAKASGESQSRAARIVQTGAFGLDVDHVRLVEVEPMKASEPIEHVVLDGEVLAQ